MGNMLDMNTSNRHNTRCMDLNSDNTGTRMSTPGGTDTTDKDIEMEMLQLHQ